MILADRTGAIVLVDWRRHVNASVRFSGLV